MNIKQGDKVRVDGKEATVECWWGAGKHRVFKLSDGREVLDLNESVVVNQKPKFKERVIEKLPLDGEDFEE